MGDSRRVIVIGSGPAGATAAHELVRGGIPVTMIESGRDFQRGLLIRAMGANLYRHVPYMQSGAMHVASGDPKTAWWYNLAPGGVSNQWTGAVPRFAPDDFTEGERLHERYRWPISYEDLAPYYDIVEPMMDITADAEPTLHLPAGRHAYSHRLPADWRRIARHAESHGHGLTTIPLADGPPWMLVRRGTAFNSFTNIVGRIRRSPNFTLITGMHALQLEWNPTLRRVAAVVCHNRADGSRQRIEGDAFIVACGPLQSTKLLFDSRCSDFPEGLGNTDGVLGRYLHDHPREWWACDVDRPLSRLVPAAYMTRGPYECSKPLMATSWTIGVVSRNDKIGSRIGLKGTSFGVQIFGTMTPSEQYYAAPAATERDEFGLPALDVRIRFDEDVIANVVRARARLIGILEEAGYRAKTREIAPQLFPGTSVHYGGSVRMHASRKYGVLDAGNRIWDAPNVLVCDASCFTTGAEKNPTLTLMAIAARAAHHLAEDLRGGLNTPTAYPAGR